MRGKLQDKFVLLWVLLTGGGLLISLLLQAGSWKLTPEIMRGDSGKVYIVTAWEAYDHHTLYLLGGISLLLAAAEWYQARPRKAVLLLVLRYILIASGTKTAHWLFGQFTQQGVLAIRPSGHMLYYIACSYLHYHCARCIFTELQWRPLACLLLLYIPYSLYCAVWTILVYHTALEICIGATTGLTLTFISHQLRLDS